MPIRICPNCGNSQPIWNILNARCKQCGYSIIDIIEKPTDYQRNKIKKHRFGLKKPSRRNWIFDVDEKEIILHAVAYGSTTDLVGIVATFPRIIGHKQDEPNQKTRWAAVVLHQFPEKSHAFPVDPTKFDGLDWICINCHHVHENECPIFCKNCGKHMWIKNNEPSPQSDTSTHLQDQNTVRKSKNKEKR